MRDVAHRELIQTALETTDEPRQVPTSWSLTTAFIFILGMM
jgi:hypothetical protein